eukprot:13658912-Alexandrium_andersonii.AAC.1
MIRPLNQPQFLTHRASAPSARSPPPSPASESWTSRQRRRARPRCALLATVEALIRQLASLVLSWPSRPRVASSERPRAMSAM